MKVFLTPRAERKLHGIWKYLKKEFGDKSAQTFKQKAFQFLKTLEQFPEIGVVEVAEKQIRSFPISTKTRVFYRVRKKEILVLTFFDVRQHPARKLN